MLTSNALMMMERSMNYLWTKQSVILDNLSNIETPNYKVKYVTFEEELRAQIQAAATGGAPQIRSALESATPTVHTAQNESARMDGNGVDANEQGIELARTALQQQHVFNAISDNITLLRTAIRGQ